MRGPPLLLALTTVIAVAAGCPEPFGLPWKRPPPNVSFLFRSATSIPLDDNAVVEAGFPMVVKSTGRVAFAFARHASTTVSCTSAGVTSDVSAVDVVVSEQQDDNTFAETTVATGLFPLPSASLGLALDVGDAPVVSFVSGPQEPAVCQGSTVSVAELTNGAFVTTSVAPNVFGARPRLAVQNGHFLVAYGGEDGPLEASTGTSLASLTSAHVDDVGAVASSVALGPSNLEVIGSATSAGDLAVSVVQTDGTVHKDLITSQHPSSQLSIAVDVLSTIDAAFHDDTTGELRFASPDSGGTFQSELVDGAGVTGLSPVVGVMPDSSTVIVYGHCRNVVGENGVCDPSEDGVIVAFRDRDSVRGFLLSKIFGDPAALDVFQSMAIDGQDRDGVIHTLSISTTVPPAAVTSSVVIQEIAEQVQ